MAAICVRQEREVKISRLLKADESSENTGSCYEFHHWEFSVSRMVGQLNTYHHQVSRQPSHRETRPTSKGLGSLHEAHVLPVLLISRFSVAKRGSKIGHSLNSEALKTSPMSKISFDAGVDRIYFPPAIPPLNIEPVVWTEETATKECNDQMPAKTNPGVQNRRSAVTRPTLKVHTPVTENFSAQNRKNLIIWRYDDGVSSRPSTGKFLGGQTESDFM